jgi:hypothetical protein
MQRHADGASMESRLLLLLLLLQLLLLLLRHAPGTA